MNAEQLDQIQARVDAATEGPWDRFDAQIRHTQIDGWTDPEGRRKAQEQTESDIDFVMNARTDVPALLALVREQQARIERVEALAGGWLENYGPESQAAKVLGSQKVSINFAVNEIRAALTATDEP